MQRLTADDDARDNGWNVERSQWCVLEVDQDLRGRLEHEEVRQKNLEKLSKRRRKEANRQG